MNFHPEEILFSPTTSCNLRCSHCDNKISKKVLPRKLAKKFLSDCKNYGIERIGFTGGEPFLAIKFLCELVKSARALEMTFGRIMTNGVWFKNKKGLENSLISLRGSGYDGVICVSVDAFHKQDLEKVALFIKMATSIWDQKDIISIASVTGARDFESKEILIKLSKLLKARLIGVPGNHCRIVSGDLFIKIFRIDLSPTGKASSLKSPWDGRWFKEDYCKGPGNVFLVMPDGSVKPCCGYATNNKELTIGNIRSDSVKAILKNIRKNNFVNTVFGSGLSSIRKRFVSLGVRFPGKTSNHCYFCNYLLENIPLHLLKRCLN